MGIAPETFRILASTDRIPYDAYTVSSTMDPKLIARLQNVLLELEPGSEMATELFRAQGQITGFTHAEDADYDGVRGIERYLDESKPPPPEAAKAPEPKPEPRSKKK
jgi:ABC-type phosphate/phosphonate transport system substrate-binding protein